jgi:hypothetical protein
MRSVCALGELNSILSSIYESVKPTSVLGIVRVCNDINALSECLENLRGVTVSIVGIKQSLRARFGEHATKYLR